MGRKKAHTPEEIVAKLRQVEVLAAQGKAVAEAVRSIGVTEQIHVTTGLGAFRSDVPVWGLGTGRPPRAAGGRPPLR